MAGVVAVVRTLMLAAEARAAVVLAGSVSAGVLACLAWLRLTDSEAVGDAPLAWSRAGGLRGSRVFRE